MGGCGGRGGATCAVSVLEAKRGLSHPQGCWSRQPPGPPWGAQRLLEFTLYASPSGRSFHSEGASVAQLLLPPVLPLFCPFKTGARALCPPTPLKVPRAPPVLRFPQVGNRPPSSAPSAALLPTPTSPQGSPPEFSLGNLFCPRPSCLLAPPDAALPLLCALLRYPHPSRRRKSAHEQAGDHSYRFISPGSGVFIVRKAELVCRR